MTVGMKSKMTDEQCESCRFWLDLGDTWARKGSCRRYPPTLGHDGTYTDLLFPRTLSRNWCGEYRRAPDERNAKRQGAEYRLGPTGKRTIPPEEAGDAQ